MSNSIVVYLNFIHKVSKNVSVSASEGLGLGLGHKIEGLGLGEIWERLGLVSDQKSNVSVSDPNVSFTSLMCNNILSVQIDRRWSSVVSVSVVECLSCQTMFY